MEWEDGMGRWNGGDGIGKMGWGDQMGRWDGEME